MADTTVRAEFAAVVLQVSVAAGDRVEADQELLVLESMKTEIPVAAPRAGRVAAVHVGEGQPVDERQPLITIGA